MILEISKSVIAAQTVAAPPGWAVEVHHAHLEHYDLVASEEMWPIVAWHTVTTCDLGVSRRVVEQTNPIVMGMEGAPGPAEFNTSAEKRYRWRITFTPNHPEWLGEWQERSDAHAAES